MLPAEIAAPGVDVLDVDDLVAMLRVSAEWLARDEEVLTALDRAIGDGDHGHNMRLGFVAVLEELDGILAAEPDLGTLLGHVGLILISAVGGASGPLYGAAFIEAGLVLSGRTEARLPDLTAALEAACRGIARRGRCFPGDKTILDALQPAADALRTALASKLSLEESLEWMQEAARQGMLSTTPLQARCGLAMRYGPRSIGHQDPGATSCHVLLKALAVSWKGRRA
jgi:phosphoenolpyruvate---glycerone phosphotransferase subunit DhaL